MRNTKCDKKSENCEFCIEGLSVSPSQELLGSDFLPFWTLSGASWQPIGPLLERFFDSLERLGNRLDRSWSDLQASQATLAVFWTVLREL